jgi:hypothetical protein
VIGAGGAFANRIYVDSWYLIGPFEAAGADPLATVHPPEESIDLEGSYRGLGGQVLGWHYASRGFYPFIPPDRAERAVYYAYTELRVDEDRDLWLSLAADDDSMLWLDGRLIWRSERRDKPWYRPPYYLPDEQVASLALSEGEGAPGGRRAPPAVQALQRPRPHLLLGRGRALTIHRETKCSSTSSSNWRPAAPASGS